MHKTTTRALATGALIFGSASCILLACSSHSGGSDLNTAVDGASDANDGAVSASADGVAAGDAAADNASPAVGTLTINEVSGKGEEWIEVVNTGTTPVDVSGYKVTVGGSGGTPSKGNEALFPTGTTIPPNGYIIAMGLPEGGTTCVAPVGVPCFNGKFSISNTKGEDTYLLNPADGVVVKVSYPANTVTTGRTWGRLPNGTGAFQITTRTPGLANKP